MPTLLPNPNRPLCGFEADFVNGPPNLVGNPRMSINAPARRTIVRSWSTTRGRQYELDQVQAGEAELNMVDPLEYLNAENTSSPFNSGSNTLKPYRALRIWAMWPTADAALRNIINPLVNSSYDASFEAGEGNWSEGLGADISVTGAQSHSGTKSLDVIAGAVGAGRGCSNRFRTAPGITYTFSAYVRPSTGTVVVCRVTDASGTTHTSAATTTPGAWQRLSVTWTAVDTLETVELYITSATSSLEFWVDDTQLEFGDTLTAFTTSGPTLYMIYNGYIERYPQIWDMHGERGIKPLTAVDALSCLSSVEIRQSYLDTIQADGPSLIIDYKDGGPPHKVVRPIGGQPMTGYAHPGTDGSVNYGGDTFLDDSNVISVVQQNANSPTSGDPQYITYAGTRGGELSADPQAFTLEAWIKFSSGTLYMGAGALQDGENPDTSAAGLSKYLGWYTASGRLFTKYTDPNGGDTGLIGIGNGALFNGFPDGQWHYFSLVLPGSSSLKHTVDNAIGGTVGLGFSPSASVAFDNIFIDVTTYFGDPLSAVSVAYLATYPFALSNLQMAQHYQRGNGYLGEVSGARVSRLLTQYWAGAVSIATGVAQLAPDFANNRRSLLEVLQEIQETERGLLYVDRAGTVVFEDRTSRYENQVALWVLGENPAGASPVEYPYTDNAKDFDPTYTFSQTNLTRPGNPDYPPEVNAAAQADYGQRILTHTLLVNSDFELEQAGLYYRTRYANAKVRISKLTLDPAANPALWPMVLSLEISQRVTVKRRSPALTTSADYYIEQINHNVDAEAGTWTVDLQLSPVFLPTVWILGDSTYGVLGSTSVCAY